MSGRRTGSYTSCKGRVLFGTGVLCAAALFGGVQIGCAGPESQTPTVVSSAVEVASPQRINVRGMEISAVEGGTSIRLESVGEPRYRLVEAAAGRRVELDLYDVALEGLPSRAEVGDGVVEFVEVKSLPSGGGRVTVALETAADATVEGGETGLTVLLRKRQAAVASASAAPATVYVARIKDGEGVEFRVGAEPSSLNAFVLSDGRRLVIDAEGVEIVEPQLIREFDAGLLSRVRIGKQDGKIRAVVEARDPGAFDNYSLKKAVDGFTLDLGKQGMEPVAVVAAVAATAEKGETEEASPLPAAELVGGGKIFDLGFRQEADRSLVEVGFSKPAAHEVREASGQRVVVDVLNTTLPERFRRALDTSAFPGPVRLIAAYQRDGDTRIVVDLHEATPFRLDRDASTLALIFQGGSASAAVEGVAQVQQAGEEIVVIEGEPEAVAPSPVAGKRPGGQEKVYTGQRLSMDFVDADIRNVLRLIGQVSGLNIVAGDDVQGKLTVRLVDVPWDQALDVILKTRGLDQVQEGNVIRIAPAERLAQEKARALEEAKAAEQQAPLVTDIIPVNYATAQELVDKVTSVLSERGTVSVDQRTNSLLVKDVAEQLEEVRYLVKRLDTQTPQVLIEARIVEVGSTFARDLGIQWGGQLNLDTAHGSSTDWAFPNSINLGGDTGAQDFAINFPSAGGLAGGPGGAIALNLGHVDDVLSLDLRLSAIETSGKGRVVSSPRVTTLDNKTAEILQGTEIPFTTATEEKIETQSIDYLLKLTVTPHVTADRSIIMQIQVTKDSPSTTFVAVDSATPAVETRAATTEVLVKDGDTTVIGGIITDTTAHNEAGVPFLSKLPGLGWLFNSKDDQVDKTELIIFITPKIMNPEAIARSI